MNEMPSTETDATTTDGTSDSQPPKKPEKRHHRSSDDNNKSNNSKDGKDDGGEKRLVPPPPIIGPDGKELERPRDAAGRPLPIYVNPDGKPVLDDQGKPIPLRFGEDGKPIPLEGRGKPSTKEEDDKRQERPVVVVQQDNNANKKVPDYITWVGAVDVVISMIVGIFYAYKTVEAYNTETKEGDKDGKLYLVVTTVVLFVTALTGALPVVAAKKNKKGILWAWVSIACILFAVQIALSSILGNVFKNSIVGALVYHAIRLVAALFLVCLVSTDGSSDTDTTNRRYVASTGRIGYNTTRGMQAPQTVVVQQPAVVPAYGYYPSYGYGYGGYYGGATDAALLGFAAGSMLGGGYYHDPWDYGYGWGGGLGGGWGGGWDDGFYDYGW